MISHTLISHSHVNSSARILTDNCGTPIEKGMARLRSAKLHGLSARSPGRYKFSDQMADKLLPFDFEKTLTQQGKPESLPACPRTWPEAKLIAPALFPARKSGDVLPGCMSSDGDVVLFVCS